MTVPAPVPAATGTPARKHEPMRIPLAPGSPLDVLMDRHQMLKARADEAARHAAEALAEIKNLVTQACNAYPVIDIPGTTSRPSMRLALRSRGNFDREALKRDHPGIHASYWHPGRPEDGTWELRPIS